MESLPDIITRCLSQHQERVEQRKNFLHPDTAAQALQPPHTPTPMFNTPSMQFPHSRLVFNPFNTKNTTTTSATSTNQQIQQQHQYQIRNQNQNQTQTQYQDHHQNHNNHYHYPSETLPLIPPFNKSMLPQSQPPPTAKTTPPLRHFNANLAN